MTNVQKTAVAVAPFVGKVLTSKQVIALTLAKYPEVNPGSILPSDYAGPNQKSGAVYADQIFQRTPTGFLVLPADKHVRKPSTRGARGESLESALKSAMALLTPASGKQTTPVANVAETVKTIVAGETAKTAPSATK